MPRPYLTAEQLEDRLAPAAGAATTRAPDDPLYPDQYALSRVAAPAAWNSFTGTGATLVAVLDTGLDASHPDLAGNVWINPGDVPGNGIDDDRDGFVDDVHGYDFVDGDANPADADGHGTHVAGIIGAVGNNAVGVAGVNWHARLMPVRVLGADSTGLLSAAVRGVDFAIARGARVINASWTIAPDPALEAAIGRARAAGVVIVAAAGNGGADVAAAPAYPAAYAASFDNVVSVVSTDPADRLAATSNYGAGVTLAAPGVNVVSSLPDGRYGRESGTSMAAAVVSGAVSLLWDAHPEWTYHQVLDRLTATVDPIPGLGGKVDAGGRLNVAKLLDLPPARAVPQPVAVGVDAGGGGVAHLVAPDGTVRLSLTPGFTGGVRVATADFNADGVADVVAGSGPGEASRVVVYDGATGVELFALAPFEPAFTGGVYVAAADLTGDGTPDAVIAPDEGGGPRVRVFDGRTQVAAADFFGIDDPVFRGGARPAVGDFNGDGRADLVVAAGVGGGPRVAVFDGRTITTAPVHLFNDLYAFEETLRNGVYVAVGDLDGDGAADLVAGGGPGGGPRVTVFSGKDLVSNVRTVRANFFGGGEASRGGIRVAVKQLDGDDRADLLVSAGSGAGNRVTAYLGKTIPAVGQPPAALDFAAFDGFTGGVFVG